MTLPPFVVAIAVSMRDRRRAVVTASAEMPPQPATIRIPLPAASRLTGGVDVERHPPCDPRSSMPLRCLIVDDNARFSASMRSLLEDEGITVVGIAASGDEAVRIAHKVGADVALVDIDLGDES